MNTKIQNLINHIIFVIDESGSMGGIKDKVVKVFDNEINRLAKRSKVLDQETRISVFKFSNSVECLIYDMDVMRTPSLEKHYRPGGGTALIDGTMIALEDLQLTPQKYGDHSFLIYVLTDGEENASHKYNAKHLAQSIAKLQDNWTFACFVPDQTSIHSAKQFGFLKDNISVWSTTNAGVEEMGRNLETATESFMRGRATGIRGTRSLFKVDTSNLTKNTVKNILQELSPKDYQILPVRKDGPIREFVEGWNGKGTYRPGQAYYMLTKTEEIQPYKQICIQDKSNGKLYTGNEARQLLSLPNNTIKAGPGNFGSWNVYISSTSVNRKLVAGTNCLVLK